MDDEEINTKLVSLAKTSCFISRKTWTVITTGFVHPRFIHDVSLHVVNFGVWCAISVAAIFTPIFKTNMLQTLRPLLHYLYDYEIMYAFAARFLSLSTYSYSCLCILRRVYPDWGFPVLFPQLWGKYQGITNQDGARPAPFQNCCVVLCIVCFVSFCVLFCVNVYCTTTTGWQPNCI